LPESHYKAPKALPHLNKKTEKQFPPYLHSNILFAFCIFLRKQWETGTADRIIQWVLEETTYSHTVK